MKKPSELFERHNPSCVQCGGEMMIGILIPYSNHPLTLWVCEDVRCPNWGLVQMGVDQMAERGLTPEEVS